jgi:hypothetical protein
MGSGGVCFALMYSRFNKPDYLVMKYSCLCFFFPKYFSTFATLARIGRIKAYQPDIHANNYLDASA